jgi:hypothetical protein
VAGVHVGEHPLVGGSHLAAGGADVVVGVDLDHLPAEGLGVLGAVLELAGDAEGLAGEVLADADVDTGLHAGM